MKILLAVLFAIVGVTYAISPILLEDLADPPAHPKATSTEDQIPVDVIYEGEPLTDPQPKTLVRNKRFLLAKLLLAKAALGVG